MEELIGLPEQGGDTAGGSRSVREWDKKQNKTNTFRLLRNLKAEEADTKAEEVGGRSSILKLDWNAERSAAEEGQMVL